MVDDAAALHALIVPASNDLAVADEHRADRDAAGAKPQPRFFDGALEEVVDAPTVWLRARDALSNCGARIFPLNLPR